jgi:hypothetical protein
LEFITDESAPTLAQKLSVISLTNEERQIPPVEDAIKPTPIKSVAPPVPVESEKPHQKPKPEVEPLPLNKAINDIEASVSKPAATASPGNYGILKILSGGVGQTEIVIKDPLTYIGTGDKAAVKIKGLLAPSLAAAISKKAEAYFLKAVKAGYPKVDGQSIQDQILLENGSMLEIGGTVMIFQKHEEKKPESA